MRNSLRNLITLKIERKNTLKQAFKFSEMTKKAVLIGLRQVKTSVI